MSRHQDSSQCNRGGAAGFTLVEVLVALTLLTTALVPAFMLASDATRLSVRIRDELIASHLAQEGVEIVRAIRDRNWFASQPFRTNLDGCAGGCAFQYDSETNEGLDPATPLRFDPATGLYQYTTGNPSPFTRIVTIVPGATSDELVATSTVRWKEGAVDKSTVIEYHLFNWLQ